MEINNIIKLKDEDSMHTHVFCPSCHYWLLGEDVGVNYCPHCGIKLFWNSEKISKVHESWHEISIERYNQLKNNIKNTKMQNDLINKLYSILYQLYAYDSFSLYQNKLHELENIIDEIIKKDSKNAE